MSDRFASLPDVEAPMGAAAILRRMVQGLGFRLHWAMAGCSDASRTFSPGADAMRLAALLVHIQALARRIALTIGADEPGGLDALFSEQAALAWLAAADDRLALIDDQTLGAVPGLATCINGPLSDALTHVGQINSWRRLAGDPAPRPYHFHGRPPK